MKSKNKDKKIHENIIGKIIYGFLLFMPLLAIGVTCAYAIFNKNAYQSYSAEVNYKYKTNEINSINDFTYGNIYHCKFDVAPAVTRDICRISAIYNFNIHSGDYINTTITENSSLYLRLTTNSAGSIYIYDTGYTGIYGSGLLNNDRLPFEFDFVYYSTIDSNYTDYCTISSSTFNILETNETHGYLDNVFYYSIDKVQQSPLFNWAEDSAIYTGMTATCNTLNITTPFIPLLMTYWLIISVIYILYDIILVILHIFHKKIHQLEDSF